MKAALRSAAFASIILMMTGCSMLMPGNKEFFQKKVPVFPDTSKIEEKQKQAAQFVAEKITEAHDEGLKAGVTNTVMEPLHEAQTVAVPLSTSLGQPTTPYHGPATNLVADMNKLTARFEHAIDKLEGKLDQLEGKKIEGTGAIQVGYFSYLAILLGIVAFLWFVLKIVGIFNPPVGLAMGVAGGVVNAGSSLLRRGFTEVVHAGEEFKNLVKNKVEDPETQQQILELFRQAHLTKQSTDVQHVIKALTTNMNDPATLAKEIQKATANQP